MKLKIFYHIYMVNHWRQVVNEQLALIKSSGLYDEADTIEIGALGESIEPLQELLKKYPKCDIVRFSDRTDRYEFWTLAIAWHHAQKDNFYGLYIHTKAVTNPGKRGGDRWREHMNEYNIKQWRENIKQLRKGYHTCGVKLLAKENNRWKIPTGEQGNEIHYSGNFFWFKSSYAKQLCDPEQCNVKSRYEAEFWIGTGRPKAATLSQEWVDYNSRPKDNTYVITLAYNLPSVTEEAVKLLYEQNTNFDHYIIDLGFPIHEDKVPRNIKLSTEQTSKKYKEMAKKYGSNYLKLPNRGVSQNWIAIAKHLNMSDSDVIIGADPDERPLDFGWVNAIAEMLRSGYDIAAIPTHGQLNSVSVKIIDKNGYKICPMWPFNFTLMGFTGKFLTQLDEQGSKRVYGWTERFFKEQCVQMGMKWCLLTEYSAERRDAQYGHEEASDLLREWKNAVVFENVFIQFDEYLKRKL